MAKTAVACAKLAHLGGGGSAICTRISSVACDGGGTGGDAPASSDADRGKQQLWSPTFLPITILPNYCLSEPVVVQKLTLMPQSAGQSWKGGAHFPIWTIDRQHNDRAQHLSIE